MNVKPFFDLYDQLKAEILKDNKIDRDLIKSVIDIAESKIKDPSKGVSLVLLEIRNERASSIGRNILSNCRLVEL